MTQTFPEALFFSMKIKIYVFPLKCDFNFKKGANGFWDSRERGRERERKGGRKGGREKERKRSVFMIKMIKRIYLFAVYRENSTLLLKRKNVDFHISLPPIFLC